MHQSSLENMADFRRGYLTGKEAEPLSILDLGSCDFNGSYRAIFSEDNWQYRGIDMTEGENVDIILRNPYRWREIPSNSADVLVSGQAMEHIEFFWLTMLEIYRVLKPGGLVCIIAPSGGMEHRYPVDCWRFFPDGFRALARYASLDVVEARLQKDSKSYNDDSLVWRDSVLVARKPFFRPVVRLRIAISHYFLKLFGLRKNMFK